MKHRLKHLFRDIFELPEHDRATLAGLLIESLEPTPDQDMGGGVGTGGRAALAGNRDWHRSETPIGLLEKTHLNSYLFIVNYN